MKHIKYFKFRIITVLLTSFMLTNCSGTDENGSSEELVKTVNVETKIIKPQSFERFIRLVGTVEAENDARISAEVAGRIVEYFVEKGDVVINNQPIAKIDDSQLLREKQRLEALTAQSRENYQRLKRLYEEEKVGSEIDYLNAKYTYEQNKASLESVKVSLEKTTVRAPFNASVEDIIVEKGEMVSPGVIIVRLIGSDRMTVSTGVPARFSEVVNNGDLARVWFDFANDDTLNLPITFVGNSIDPQARTFEVEISIPRRERKYKVDMVANVMIRTLKEEDVLVVSEEYLFQQEEGYVVFTVGQNPDGSTAARQVSVKLGASYENRVVIEDGLNPGDNLITVGSSFLQDGMRISIVENGDSEIVQNK